MLTSGRHRKRRPELKACRLGWGFMAVGFFWAGFRSKSDSSCCMPMPACFTCVTGQLEYASDALLKSKGLSSRDPECE